VRRGWAVLLAAVAVASAGIATTFAILYFTSEPEVQVERPCGDRTFGHIHSLARASGRWVMRFDPAWFTSGETANVAAAEDGVVQPGEPVPNDNYRIDEGHRLLTYFVAPDARVRVLARQGDRFGERAITFSELAQLTRGAKPIELFEPLDTGVWIRVHVDTVCELEQQYLP